MSARRYLTINVQRVHARTGWNNAALVLFDGHGDSPRTVTVNIRNPGEIAYLRERLQDIETAWRKALESINQ